SCMYTPSLHDALPIWSEFHSAFSHSDNFNLLMTVSYGLDVFRPAIILIMDHNRRSHFQHIIQSRRLIKRHIDTAVGTDSRRLIRSEEHTCELQSRFDL